jgi:hypothetical protein
VRLKRFVSFCLDLLHKRLLEKISTGVAAWHLDPAPKWGFLKFYTLLTAGPGIFHRPVKAKK